MKALVLRIALIGSLGAPALGNDWPYWRGPEQTGASREPAPVTTWSPAGENLVWKSDIGGRTTPVVMGGRVFYICPVDMGTPCSAERVVCLDAASGKPLWEHRFNVYLTDVVENRVGWTALVGDPETGNIFAHTTGGEFCCFDRDGRVLWNHSLTEEYGRVSGYGGRLATPVVDEDWVMVNYLSSSWGTHARPRHRFLFFDKKTGDVINWMENDEDPLDTTYATPAVAVVNGQRLLIAPANDGVVYAFQARTGKPVWKYRLSKRGLNTSVVVSGDYAYVTHSEENLGTTEMGSVVCINAALSGDITESGTVWRNDGMGVGYASPALANGRLYVVDNSASLFALDARTGQVIWDHNLGRVGKGSPTVTADGVIYVGEQNGMFHILRDTGNECTTLDVETFDRDDGLIDEIFGSPAVADGRLYFMTRYGMYCLGSGEGRKVDAPIPPPPPEADREGTQISGFALRPADVLLSPGQKVSFTLRAFDSQGRWVTQPFSSMEPQWTLAGVPGKIENETLTVAPDVGFAGGLVKVKWVGDAEVTARVRVLPALPVEESFDGMKAGDVPPAWLGVGGGPRKKCVVEQRDGQTVLTKLASKEFPSPPFMRIQPFATPVIAGGMTIECDLMSEQKSSGRRSYLPDMGLTNTRYELVLAGADKSRGKATQLTIESWGDVPRLSKKIDFDWNPDTWYRVKFEVRVDGGKANCRAKVWPRDAEEPAGWSLEVTDDCPNTEGAASVYAYSTGTTPGSDGPRTFFDNLRIYKND